MLITATTLPDVKEIRPVKHGDARGFFSETYRRSALREAGIDVEFVQDNHSLSAEIGTVRGLHFQVPPAGQAKLVRVVRGAILDVVVDLRRGSPSYGRHVALRVSASEWNQVYVPVGFAHGFCTLEPETEVLYKTSDYYSPAHDAGVRFDDPALGIAWPVTRATARLSAKDAALPLLAELDSPFVYAGAT